MRGTFALFAIAAVPCVALAFQNEPDGFRGIKWGAPQSDLASEFVASPSTANRDATMLRRAGDKMAVGEAELTDVVYFFYDGSFSSAMVKSVGASNKRALIRAFQTQFGSGHQANRYIDRFVWFGPIARISLDCGVRDECIAFIGSTAAATKELADRKAGAEKAKQDF